MMCCWQLKYGQKLMHTILGHIAKVYIIFLPNIGDQPLLRYFTLQCLLKWHLTNTNLSSTIKMAPQSLLCLIHLPRAWFKALKAWISYQSLPGKIFGLLPLFSSLYFFFRSTKVSFTAGNGMPTQMTALVEELRHKFYRNENPV